MVCLLTGSHSQVSPSSDAAGMLVPKFSITQTDQDLHVRIRVPYVRVGDAEVHVVSSETKHKQDHLVSLWSTLLLDPGWPRFQLLLQALPTETAITP